MDNSTLEMNKKIARQSFEAFEQKDYTFLEKLCDVTKFKLHFPGIEKALNFDESVKLNKEYNEAFPDVKVTVENQIAEGDLVASRVTYQGTHKGELQGVSPSGKKAKVTGMSLQRIVNSKIVEEWNEFDALGMMQQIGAIPEPAHS
jgi:predicted ester cyclase